MNALELLKADHEKVKQLFKKAEDANPERQRQLFEEIKQELETHTHIEETVFYPAVKEADELKDMVLEFKVVAGKAVGFEVRGDGDELWAKGKRKG